MDELRINLGCNDDLRLGYVNVDQAPPADLVVDLRERWPWERSTVTELLAHDVFEHIDSPRFPGNKGKIWAMNEAWRVLKPGGVLHLRVPSIMQKDRTMNPGAFADPTHVSFWTMDDRYYFCERWNNPQGERGRLGAAYGIAARFKDLHWELEEYGAGEERRAKIHGILEAVK